MKKEVRDGEKNVLRVKALFQGDSKNFHRYNIGGVVNGVNEVVGSIYIPKNGNVPDKVIVELVTETK